ncbi:MAG TPA: hypothetical protein VEU31_06335 [Candidatus Acidoferrales bacterium]|nr:hypothetical protein [Candidatus Acidoferrales bacterium]
MTRKKSAIVCLVAVLLMFAPGPLASLAASGAGDCCAAGLCPAGHRPPKPAPKRNCHEESPLRDSSLQPCHQEERTAVTTNVFLLTAVVSLVLEIPVEWKAPSLQLAAPSFFPEIVSPPPRMALS